MKIKQTEQQLYDQHYFGQYRRDSRRETAYWQDAFKIAEHASKLSCSVLDIGGGLGEFGEHLRPYGYTYFCYDPYTFGNFIPEDLWDVVVFRGVLQHIYNPIEMLNESFDCLVPGGLLAILATPDTDSIGYLRWGTLPALDAPRNWVPFGHKMLSNILVRLGYERIEFAWPYGEPYAIPVRNVWNFIRGKPDAFPGNMMECFAYKPIAPNDTIG